MTPIIEIVDPRPRAPVTTRGGLILFDVGVGRTFTALAMIASARAKRLQRPVILVPRSIQWTWVEAGGDAVTPAEALEKLLPAWRAGLPADYAADFIDEFVARNRAVLLALVDRALTTRRVKRGLLPRNAAEFAAYGKLVPRERARDAEPDDEVLRQLLEFTNTSRKAKDRVAREVAGYLYARRRAEAMVLRREGWDAVPMMLRDPALVIVEADQAIAVMDVMREVSVASGFVRARELRNDLAKIYKHIGDVSSDINEPRLERFALALWSRIRGAAPTRPSRRSRLRPTSGTRRGERRPTSRPCRPCSTVKPGELTGEDLQKIARYSGWGGLSIERVQDRIPKELVPESFGLIHEYYTPTVIAESIAELLCPLLPELAGNDGVVRALEPSAGIGRLIRAFSPRAASRSRPAARSSRSRGPPSSSPRSARAAARAAARRRPLPHALRALGRDEGPRFHRGTSASSSRTRPTASAARWPARTPTSSTRRSGPTRTSCAARSTSSSLAASACSSCPRGS
jgi:hypothetical protein